MINYTRSILPEVLALTRENEGMYIGIRYILFTRLVSEIIFTRSNDTGSSIYAGGGCLVRSCTLSNHHRSVYGPIPIIEAGKSYLGNAVIL